MERHLIVTVHGTWSLRGSDELSWWEAESDFCKALKQELSEQKIAAEFLEFEWSGGNSAIEREEASRNLSVLLTSRLEVYQNVSVLAHSHGGNVVADAVPRIHQKTLKRGSLKSVVCFGTPFLKQDLPLERRLTKIISLSSSIIMMVIGLFGLIIAVTLLFQGNIAALGGVLLGYFILIGLPGIVLIYWVMPKVLNLNGRVNRWRTVDQNFIFRTICHPNDEVLNALKFAIRSQIRFVKPATVRRKLTSLSWKLVVIAMATLLVGMLSSGSLPLIFIGEVWSVVPWLKDYTLWVFVNVLICALILYSTSLVLSRPLSFFASRLVSGILRGLATGQDNELNISEVSNKPFLLWSTAVKLSPVQLEELESNVRLGRAQAVKESSNLISEYKYLYGDIIRLPVSSSVSVNDVLLHNSYFGSQSIRSQATKIIADAQLTNSRSLGRQNQSHGIGRET